MKTILIIPIIAVSLFTLNSCTTKGCKVPCASNYDSKATEDGGNCEYSMPAGTTTSVLMTPSVIDFATGKVDSLTSPCSMAHYEADLLLISETAPGLSLDTQFPHKGLGDTTCKGTGGDIDQGGSWALISGYGQAEDQNWKTCAHSPAGFAGGQGVKNQAFYVVKTREGKFYKVHVDNIINKGGLPQGVTITWIAMEE